jgi:hypothetical protein
MDSNFLKVVAVMCRCVSLDRLPFILANGCDVEPTNSPMFCDSIHKATEYGGSPQVVQVFGHEGLKRTFKRINVDFDPSEIERLKGIYRSWEASVNGNNIWFSMFSFEDRRRNSAYELAYGWYIPGDPWKALIALAIFVETDQHRNYALGLLDGWVDPSAGSVVPKS